MIALVLIATTAAAELDGRYALSLHAVTQTKIPFLGWTRSETVSTMLVDILERDGRLVQRQEVCGIRVEGKARDARVSFPDAFVRSMPVKELAVELAPDDSGTVRYRVDLGTDHVGYDPALTGGRVPLGSDAPGVVDGDGDGHPGVTVHLDVPVLGRTELYVVQRGSMVLEGLLDADGDVEGAIELGPIVQRTIAASNPLLVASPRIVPDPDASWFSLRKIAETSSCADLSH
jgi:hypothetical protein